MNHAGLRLTAEPPRDGRAAWAALRSAAAAPYDLRGAEPGWRFAWHFAWHFARGKLGRDPVFRSLLERGDLVAAGRVVDIGCGQGILAALLQACNAHRAQWPAAWPPAPRTTAYTGIELMQRDVLRAERALHRLPLAPRFVCADMRDAALPPCDTVVILDVLHYVDHAAQQALLERVRTALQQGRAGGAPGRLLMRIGDVADRPAYRISQWVDRAVTLARGHRVAPTWGRTVADWHALLEGLGFTAEAVPMSAGTPFANVLLVAEMRPTVAA